MNSETKIAFLSTEDDNYTWEPFLLFLQTIGYSYMKIFNQDPLGEADPKLLEEMSDYDLIITYGQGKNWFTELLLELNMKTIYRYTADKSNIDKLRNISARNCDPSTLSREIKKMVT